MEGNAIYQRTEDGRYEIRAKQRGLTQSERQALILIDGITSYDGLCLTLKKLHPPRLDQILRKLAQKGLILELLLPNETGAEETFEPAIVDRFLRQDPLDPITIIASDPEPDAADTDLGPDSVPDPVPPAPVIDLNSWVARAAAVRPPAEASAVVDFYLPLPEVAAEEVVNPDEEGAVPPPRAPQPPQTSGPTLADPASARLTWHAWIIALGLVLILAPVLVRILSR